MTYHSRLDRRRRIQQNQAQLAATLTLIVVVGIIIAALYLIQTTTTTTTKRELEEMSDHRARLQRDNERLRAEIADLQSLPRVMTRAAEMGFRPASEEEIQYLIVDGYRYNRPQVTPTPTPTPNAPEEIYDETLGGWLQKQWDKIKEQFSDWRNE
ncbi:MAG: cell division protein FtsL [Anaerolineae bacterium]|nr:cell division protein FtsL [Anaerolineae bacterium]